MITVAQHGFTKPCDTKIISFLGSFTELASQRNPLDTIYLDNSKTCDKVVYHLCGQSEHGQNRPTKLNHKIIFYKILKG